MSRKRIECRPGARQMLYALARNPGMNPTAALRELFDNSFNADSWRVVFKHSRKNATVEVIDDGHGTVDVEAIVTPFKHLDHPTPGNGRYGVGGTLAQMHLTNGLGSVEVVSRTKEFLSTITADFRRIAEEDVFNALVDVEPNRRPETGTRITLTGCRDLAQYVGSARRELEFTFAPALRLGRKIIVEADGKVTEWAAYEPPARDARAKFDFVVGGHRVKGFCDLVKPGQTNQAKGFAVSYVHRFLGKFTEPFGDRAIDPGRIYGEVHLENTWPNVTVYKDGFLEPPTELWAGIEERCAGIFDRAEQEGPVLELDAATRAAQDVLDQIVGNAGPGIKGRRPGKAGKSGSVVPTGNGSPHAEFTFVQPGDKPSRGTPAGSRRIHIAWTASPMDPSYEVRAEARRVRIILSRASPVHQILCRDKTGESLAAYVIHCVAADWVCIPGRYCTLFPGEEAQDVARVFDSLWARRREAVTAALGL